MVVKIKQLPPLERPYEKLELYGVESLSNEELLAILLKTGFKDISSKELSSMIISKVDSISDLKSLSYEKLISMKGIGKSKACTILASIELARRIEEDKYEIKNRKLTSSEMVYEYYKLKIGDKKQEYFYVVYLDNAKNIIRDKLLFIGTINYSVVHPREVFKEAYLLSASSIICMHNHPSGDVCPSSEDLFFTKTLYEIGKIQNIKVLDHIIVSNDTYYSFFENGNIF